MIDIHAHVLPGVDDGPETLDESILLIKEMIRQGITVVVATPHFNREFREYSKSMKAFELLKNEITKLNLPIDLRLGGEIQLNENTINDLRENKLCTLGQSKYILLELPYTKMYPVHYEWIHEIQLKGYTIILAHVERYTYLTEDSNKVRDLINRGIYMQMNASCLLDKKTRKLGEKLITNELIHFIASDTHNLKSRHTRLLEAKKIMSKKFKPNIVEDLVYNNANSVLTGGLVKSSWKKPIRKSMFQQFIQRPTTAQLEV